MGGDLDLLIETVQEAGAMAMSYYRADLRSWEKGSEGPVSEADLAVDALLRRRLIKARPDYGWLSEETADDGSRLACRRVFIVDPIDGTRAFLKGNPAFCVSAAVVEDGRTLHGVVFNPATDELFAASAGDGAVRNGERISASPRDRLEGARLIGYRQTFEDRRWPRAWPPLEVSQYNSIAYTLCRVAAGANDGAVSLTAKNDWDLAAASLIVAEAGGRASTHDGLPFAFNRMKIRHPSVVAAGPNLHPLLLDRLSAFRP